jgi:hypothetical protein
MLLSLYPVAYETVESRPRIEYEYYAERKNSRERNISNDYISDILTLESPINLNRSLQKCLKQIKNLEDNWDGYGAIRPSLIAYNRVEIFLKNCPNSFIEPLGQDNIYPNPNGTISIEWENSLGGVASLEIGDENATFFAKSKDGEIYIDNNVYINDGGVNPEVLETISKIV